LPSDGTDYQSLPNTLVALLPTPTARDPKGENQRGDDTCLTGALLPTPRATDGTKGGPNQRGSSGDLMLPSAVSSLLPTPSVADSTGGHERRGGARGEELLLKGVARAVAEGQLLPTPTAMDSAQSGGGYNGQSNVTLTDATVRQPSRWGDYADAIRRHELALGRPAPAPTKLNAKGKPKLSDEFDEWLMMLPAGWITDVPGITWNETLKACGNGVVPPQAVAAIRQLLERIRRRPPTPTNPTTPHEGVDCISEER
jgi:DNA (cytosine-5)-methyltransferase 1